MGLKAKIKSVYRNVGGGISRAIAGWTGLKDCGNLLTNKLDVGNNFTGHQSANLFGYVDPVDATPFGSLSPAIINGVIIYAVHGNISTVLNIIRMGAAGNEQIPAITILTLQFQSFTGTVDYTWNAANLQYENSNAALVVHQQSLDGQRVSFDTQYDTVAAFSDNTVTFEDFPVTNNVQVVIFN